MSLTSRNPRLSPRSEMSPYVSSSAICELLERADEIDDSAILSASSTLLVPPSLPSSSSSSWPLSSLLPGQNSSSTPLFPSFPFLTRITSASIQWRKSAPLDFITPTLFSLPESKAVKDEMKGTASSTTRSTERINQSQVPHPPGGVNYSQVGNEMKAQVSPSCLTSPPTAPCVSLLEEFLIAADTRGGLKNSTFCPAKGYSFPLRPWPEHMKREAGIKSAQQMFLEEFCHQPSSSLSSLEIRSGQRAPFSAHSSTPEKSLAASSVLSSRNDTFNNDNAITPNMENKTTFLQIRPFFLRQTALEVLLLLQMQQQQEENKVNSPSFSSPSSVSRSHAKIWLLDSTPAMIRFAVLPRSILDFHHPAPRVFRLICLTGNEWKNNKHSTKQNTPRMKCGPFLPLSAHHALGHCCNQLPYHPRRRARSPSSCEVPFPFPDFPSYKKCAADPCKSMDKNDLPVTSRSSLHHEKLSSSSKSLSHPAEPSLKEKQNVGENGAGEIGKEPNPLSSILPHISLGGEEKKFFSGVFHLMEERKISALGPFVPKSSIALNEERSPYPVSHRCSYFYWDPASKLKHTDQANIPSSVPAAAATDGVGISDEEKWWVEAKFVVSSLIAYQRERIRGNARSQKGIMASNMGEMKQFSPLPSKEHSNQRKTLIEGEETYSLQNENKGGDVATWWATMRFVSSLPFFSRAAVSPERIAANMSPAPSSIKVETGIPSNGTEKAMLQPDSSPKEEILSSKKVMRTETFDPIKGAHRGGSATRSLVPRTPEPLPSVLHLTLHSNPVPPSPTPVFKSYSTSTPSNRTYAQCMEKEVKKWSFSLFTFASHIYWCDYVLNHICSRFSSSSPVKKNTSSLIQPPFTTRERTGVAENSNPSILANGEVPSSSPWAGEVCPSFVLLANPAGDSINLPSGPQQSSIFPNQTRKWSSLLVLALFGETPPSSTSVKKTTESTSSKVYGLDYSLAPSQAINDTEEKMFFLPVKVDGCRETLQWSAIQEVPLKKWSKLHEKEEKGNFHKNDIWDPVDKTLHRGTLCELLSFITL